MLRNKLSHLSIDIIVITWSFFAALINLLELCRTLSVHFVRSRHSQGRYYSVEGLKICIDYFLNRGHKVKAFIPHHRMRRGQSTNPSLLQYLQKKNLLVLTPSRRINGRSYMCYDDRCVHVFLYHGFVYVRVAAAM